ncbi:MAG TPA: PepSY-associated TM helix domain-containing protein, partial [Steroidobacteraceae bacterium]
LQRFPGAQLSGAAFPNDERPWYRIRIRQPGEWRRVYGTTTIYVAAADGHVLRVDDPLVASRGRRFLDNLYPVHTGEAGGFVGRLLTFSVAAWLLSMLVLGLGLWWIRRARRASA